MNFEGPSLYKEKKKTKSFLSVEGLKYLLRRGILIGTLSLATLSGVKGIEETIEYKGQLALMSLQEKKECEELEEKIKKSLGTDSLNAIKGADIRAFSRRKEKSHLVDIDGFEKNGIDQKKLERLFSDQDGAYPKDWITGQVSSVEYVDIEKREGPDQDLVDARVSKKSKKIEFFKNKGAERLSELDSKYVFYHIDLVFGHELGHQNDWESSGGLSLIDRVRLISRILDDMNGPTPFKGPKEIFSGDISYHERITTIDPKEQEYFRAKEYWAELCNHYFQVPDWMKEKYPEAYNLVDEYVKKSDQNFDPIIAKSKRVKIIEN